MQLWNYRDFDQWFDNFAILHVFQLWLYRYHLNVSRASNKMPNISGARRNLNPTCWYVNALFVDFSVIAQFTFKRQILN